jgi:hypothetical protein
MVGVLMLEKLSLHNLLWLSLSTGPITFRQCSIFSFPIFQCIHKKLSSLPSSTKDVFQRNLKCIFSVPFSCYWSWLPSTHLLQSASGMPDRNDKLYFLWSSPFFATFYLPSWTPPLPHLLLSYRLIVHPTPSSVRPWGYPSLLRFPQPHNEMASSQLVRTYFISSTLRYYTIRRTYSLGWYSRQMRSASISETARQDREERRPACHRGRRRYIGHAAHVTCIGHDGALHSMNG